MNMSVALYVALEQEIPGFDASSVSGKFLAKAQKKLDSIAKRLGLQPLEAFISTNPDDVLDFLEGEGGVPEGMEIPAEEWFEPVEGQKTVRGLLDHLRHHPTSVRNPADVSADLEDIEAMLAAAAKRGVRFHLAVDF
jgi:hypothetical protein